ncbi:MAG: anhydro-N-acetylmuramic acid kinase [Halarsenatibacteraceae bacterium]
MLKVAGVMSGTSLDGIDVVIVATDRSESSQIEILSYFQREYPAGIKERLNKLVNNLHLDAAVVLEEVASLNLELGELYADAIRTASSKAGLQLSELDLIGCHGQTVFHKPGGGKTISLQLGSGSVIAEGTGVDTITNFRLKDIAAGGEGAPLVPLIDFLLYQSSYSHRFVVNIGGIANYTWLPADSKRQEVRGSDTGPGNMMIDAGVQKLTDGELDYDQDGIIAGQGQLDRILYDRLFQHEFFDRSYPRSTGRYDFGRQYTEKIIAEASTRGVRDVDIIRTLTEFTASSLVESFQEELVKEEIDTLKKSDCLEVIISGGGSHNQSLLNFIAREISERFHNYRTELISLAEGNYDSYYLPAIDADQKEAVAFALLAREAMMKRPGNLPAVTGARHPVIAGDLTPGTEVDF